MSLDPTLRKLRLWDRARFVTGALGVLHTRELYFQGIFHRALDSLGVRTAPLYPVGAAANYGLLYATLRAVTEMDLPRILDIGAGQTTLLLDALAKADPELRVVTLEADREWSHRLAGKVAHEIVHRPLARREIMGATVEAFERPAFAPDVKFDLVIVDGPNCTPRRSRWAVLEILRDHLAPEFLVIFDDAERLGEQDTIRAFVRSAQARPGFNTVIAAKCQLLVFTPAHDPASCF